MATAGGETAVSSPHTSKYFFKGGPEVDGNFLGVVGDIDDDVDGGVLDSKVASGGLLFSGRSFPLKGSLTTAGAAARTCLAGAASSGWRRARSFSRRLGPWVEQHLTEGDGGRGVHKDRSADHLGGQTESQNSGLLDHH